jgi:hypothetical protein
MDENVHYLVGALALKIVRESLPQCRTLNLVKAFPANEVESMRGCCAHGNARSHDTNA